MFLYLRKLSHHKDLTEEEIRGLSINFLKNHYKFRPHKVKNGIEVKNERHEFGGIIIDASLNYTQQDGTKFIATVEASSLNRANEVYYRYHWFRLLFESTALALTITAITYGLLASSWENWLVSAEQPGGIQSGIHLFFGSFILFASLMALLFPKRYRYIYAVEQFKLFHADDQWIAYDTELFHTHDDKAYVELERQCMRYGFGLLQVERDRRVRIMVSPKRGDYFGQKRKKLPFWAEQLSTTTMLADAMEKRYGGSEEVDETILLKDPLEQMNFEPPSLELAPVEEEPVETAEQPETKEQPAPRSLPKWLPQPIKKVFSKTNEVAKPPIKDRITTWKKENTPKFVKESPGFFRPPARWNILLLSMLIFNAIIIISRIAAAKIVPLENRDRSTLTLETYREDSRVDPQILEEELDALGRRAEDYEPAIHNNDLVTVIDEYRMDRLAPKVGSDVMFYNLAVEGDTLVMDRCPKFSRGEQRIYAMVYGRYNDLDAALEDAFRLHTDLGQEISVVQGECLQQSATAYMVIVGKPSVDEGEINLRFRRLRKILGSELEILPF